MDKKQLSSRMEIVLTKEHDNLLEGPTFELIDNEGKLVMDYPHSETLVDIFSNIQNLPDMKNAFVEILKDRISIEGETINQDTAVNIPDHYAGAVALSFYTLIKLGFTKEAIDALKMRKHVSVTLVRFLRTMLKESYGYFTIEEFNDILVEISRYGLAPSFASTPRSKFNVERGIARSRILEESYSILKKEIRGVNIEINQDRKSLSEKIGYLEFDPKYNDLLNDIDEFINKDTSAAVSAGMIGNLREFLGDLFTDTAKKIAGINGEEIPKYQDGSGKDLGSMGNIRRYLKIHLGLSDEDHKFINGFIDVLHSNGGHSFSSNKEYFRLARNIAIEIALLILSKYEKKFN